MVDCKVRAPADTENQLLILFYFFPFFFFFHGRGGAVEDGLQNVPGAGSERYVRSKCQGPDAVLRFGVFGCSLLFGMRWGRGPGLVLMSSRFACVVRRRKARDRVLWGLGGRVRGGVAFGSREEGTWFLEYTDRTVGLGGVEWIDCAGVSQGWWSDGDTTV